MTLPFFLRFIGGKGSAASTPRRNRSFLAVRLGLQTPLFVFSCICNVAFLNVSCADGFCYFYGVCRAYCRGEHCSPDNFSLLFFFAKKKKRSKKRKAFAYPCLCGNVLHERQCYFRYMQHKFFGRYAAGEPCSPLRWVIYLLGKGGAMWASPPTIPLSPAVTSPFSRGTKEKVFQYLLCTKNKNPPEGL